MLFDSKKPGQNAPEPPAKKKPQSPGAPGHGVPVVEILLVLVLLVGVALIAYPTVADWWNGFHQSRAIASMVETIDEIGPVEREEALRLAADYNESLVHVPNRLIQAPEGGEEYAELLDITGTGIMGYVEVPSQRIKLPIYHGTNEAVLQVATGHLPGSSLPVGGESTHTVITGHSALPSARLFTDVAKLEIGDVFMITALEDPLAYEVDQIKVVLPEEFDDLAIVEGMDYATLVTCTPYGVNSHRLLIRGHRIPMPEAELDVPVVVNTWRSAWPYLLGLVAITAGAATLANASSKRKRQRARAEKAAREAQAAGVEPPAAGEKAPAAVEEAPTAAAEAPTAGSEASVEDATAPLDAAQASDKPSPEDRQP